MSTEIQGRIVYFIAGACFATWPVWTSIALVVFLAYLAVQLRKPGRMRTAGE